MCQKIVKTGKHFRGPSAGFSLIEMLIVIAVIGILSAIGIGAFGNHREAFKDIQARRNAQELATEFQTAQVAGIDFYVAGDKAATIGKIVSGAVANKGIFAGRRYGLNQIGPAEQATAAAFLVLTADGWLTYNSNP